MQFAPNQSESHTEIIHRFFIHCIIRLLVARKLQKVEGELKIGKVIVGTNLVGMNLAWGKTGIIL